MEIERLQKIEKDLEDINSTMKILNECVNNQTESINDFEEFINDSKNSVKHSVNDLEYSEKINKSKLKTLAIIPLVSCFFGFKFFIVGGVVSYVLYKKL